MKNIIERIAGGAKIARYLLKAVSTRLAVAALAVCAAGSAWAATLSYSGYISTDKDNPSTVFSGVTLSDIGSTYVLKGNMGGGWVSTAGDAGVYNASNDGTTLTVQFQKIDGSGSEVYAKCVVVKFTQDGDNIKAYASATGASSTLTLGQAFSNASGTPASGASVNGYGIYDISLAAGRKVRYQNTWTTSNDSSIGGGNAPTTDSSKWTMHLPATTDYSSGYAKVTSVKLGSRNTSWTTTSNGDTPVIGVVDINGDEIKSEAISGYGEAQLAALNSLGTVTAKYSMDYVFPDATPLMLEVGDTTGKAMSLYLAEGTSYSKGGIAVVKTSVEATSSTFTMTTMENSGWRALHEVEALMVATASISEAATWSTLAWTNPAADWTAAGSTPVLLTVTEDCTITLDSTVSLESVIFDITPGKTLTIAGSNNLTAANGIIVKGGTIAMTSSLLRGNVYGNGTLEYVGVRPTTTGTDVVLTNNYWTGVVCIKNYDVANTLGSNNATKGQREMFPQYWGSANSKIKWNGVCGYFGNKTSAAGWILEDLTVDDTTYPALRKNDGGSSSTTTAPSLSGSGTFADASNPTEIFKFADGSSFAGSINITSNSGYGMNVQFGATAVVKVARTIHVLSGATVNVAANKTWAAPGGMVVAGTLTVGSGATVPTITTTNTAQYQFAANATIGTVSGDALASALYITSGTLAVSDTSKTTLTIPAQLTTTYHNAGTLDLRGCTSLTALMLDLGNTVGAGLSLSNITLPAGCTVYAEIGSVRDMSAYTSLISGATYLVEETKAEYGAGSLTVENVPTGASVSVLRPGGTIVAATVDGTTATLTGEIKIDGAATLFDVTFTNTTTFANKPSGSASYVHNTGVYNNENADKSTGCMLYVTPWLGSEKNLTELPSFQNCMTLAVVGQMPAAQDDAMFIHLGGCASGYKGFLIARMAEDNKVRVAYNNGSTVTTLTTMTVPNASTARHAYVITKEDTASTTTFTIYLDGIKWKTVTLNSVLTISGGVQVGSDFHGEIHKKTQTDEDGVTQYTIKSLTSSASPDAGYATDTTGYVNCIRLYDRILTQAEINQYSDQSEYPYVPPYGSAVRTFTAASETWVDTTENSTVWANTKDKVTTTSGTPASGAALTVNTDVATTIGVNLAESTSYEAITVNGIGATFQFDGESTGKITVTGSSVIGAPTTIVAGALDISGGPVTMTEDGSLTFDYSNYEVTSATAIRLTGPIARNDSAVTITVPTNPYYTYTAGWDTSSEQYVITPTANAAVLIHGGTQTGYATFAEALDDAVSGDTIDLTANVSTENLSFEGSLALTSSSAVTLTASGSIVLPTAASTLSVNGVTLSPAPTTTVAGSYVKATTTEGVTTYSVCANPSVSDVAFSYGADYASATVTATVSDATLDYYISWAGGEPVMGSVSGSGSQVTFDVSGINHTTEYQSAAYSITAKDGETDVTTTGGSGTTVAADVVAAGWINENATTTGTSAGGSWTNAVTYTNGKAEISDNRFEATTASTASRVVLEFNVCFSSVSDANVDGTAQAAIKIGEVESAATFMVLAPNSSWTPVFNADLTPDPAATYKVVLTIDYGAGSYGVTVGDNALTNATGSASFPLAKSGATSVQTIDFAGSGTLTSMKGDQIEGYMVKDNAGHWYATIQDAAQAYNSANGPYTVLHSGTAPSGWKIDGNTLIKLAKGFFFMAY